jgi:hypothetical protein
MLLDMFLMASDIGEAIDDVWPVVQGLVGVGLLGIGVYGLFTGKFSGGLPLRASRFNPLRVFMVSNWPITEAVVTEAALRPWPEMPYSIVTAFTQRADGLDVRFAYEVEGVKYLNTFTVVVSTGFWSRVTTSVAPGEKLMVRYDPRDPADSVPVEKTWHGWNVWAEG